MVVLSTVVSMLSSGRVCGVSLTASSAVVLESPVVLDEAPSFVSSFSDALFPSAFAVLPSAASFSGVVESLSVVTVPSEMVSPISAGHHRDPA